MISKDAPCSTENPTIINENNYKIKYICYKNIRHFVRKRY